MKLSIASCIALAIAFATTSVARGNVFVVDGAFGPIFDIQTAITSADDGDTILVKSGTYGSFFIVNKSLVVVADANNTVTVNNGVEVRNLAANRDVVIAGLTIHGDPNATDWHGNGIYLKNNLGSVRIRCDVYGASAPSSANYPAFAGAEVIACADVAFEGATLHGGITTYGTGAGLDASGSNIAMYDTSAAGSSGHVIQCDDGSPGAPGVSLVSSFLFAANSVFSGGTGGNGSDGVNCGGRPGNGGNGGSGIVIAASTPGSDAELVNVQLDWGYGGFGGFGGLFNGLPGQPGSPSVVASGSTLNSQSAPQRTMTAPSVVRELAPLTLTYHGQPGDVVGVYIGTGTSFHYLPAQEGVKLVSGSPGTPVYAGLLGSANGSGNLSARFAFPDLGPGVQSKELYLQAIVLTPQGARVLGSATSLSVLDSSF